MCFLTLIGLLTLYDLEHIDTSFNDCNTVRRAGSRFNVNNGKNALSLLGALAYTESTSRFTKLLST
jgi:hypothetical protein